MASGSRRGDRRRVTRRRRRDWAADGGRSLAGDGDCESQGGRPPARSGGAGPAADRGQDGSVRAGCRKASLPVGRRRSSECPGRAPGGGRRTGGWSRGSFRCLCLADRAGRRPPGARGVGCGSAGAGLLSVGGGRGIGGWSRRRPVAWVLGVPVSLAGRAGRRPGARCRLWECWGRAPHHCRRNDPPDPPPTAHRQACALGVSVSGTSCRQEAGAPGAGVPLPGSAAGRWSAGSGACPAPACVAPPRLRHVMRRLGVSRALEG